MGNMYSILKNIKHTQFDTQMVKSMLYTALAFILYVCNPNQLLSYDIQYVEEHDFLGNSLSLVHNLKLACRADLTSFLITSRKIQGWIFNFETLTYVYPVGSLQSNYKHLGGNTL